MGEPKAALERAPGSGGPARRMAHGTRVARRPGPLNRETASETRPTKPLLMQVAGVQELLFLPLPADAEAAGKQLKLMHRKARVQSRDFASAQEREAFKARDEAAALVPLLPAQVVRAMMGGDLGIQQVPCPERRERMLVAMLLERAGTEGDRLASLRALLRCIRAYSVRHRGASTISEADARSFPMSSALAHEVIASEHERATADPAKPGGGATVGNGVRDSLIFASEKMLWPIEVPRVALKSAAPPAKAGTTRKAGTLPIAVKCHLETIARDGPPASVTGEARAVCRFYARSLLAAGIDQSVRVAEGIRVELLPDPVDPDGVMYGIAYVGKDGSPLEIRAPAEGFTGPYEWFPEHLREVLELGQSFPMWVKPWGSHGSILEAGGMKRAVAEKADSRLALKGLLSLEPLSYTAAEIKLWNLQGHSGHASPPEWARTIGTSPTCPGLDPGLSRGFGPEDSDALGHWLRDAGAKAEASAAEAAREAEPADARRAAAMAALPGRPAVRGAMRIYYGLAGTGGSRISERVIQLDVRQRLAHTVRAIIGDRRWQDLPRGPADLEILAPAPFGGGGGQAV